MAAPDFFLLFSFSNKMPKHDGTFFPSPGSQLIYDAPSSWASEVGQYSLYRAHLVS